MLGIGIYSLVLRPLIKKEAMVVTLMIATLAVDVILIGLFGAYAETFNTLTHHGSNKIYLYSPGLRTFSEWKQYLLFQVL